MKNFSRGMRKILEPERPSVEIGMENGRKSLSHDALGKTTSSAPASWMAGLLALSILSAVALGWQLIEPSPLRFAGLSVDRLSAAMTLLVASVGAVTYRFALRYLDGDPRQRLFLRRLCLTVMMAYLLMLADHLLILVAFWSFTSLGLHWLLLHDPTREEAHRPARKKFLISRLGDLALIAAIVIIHENWGVYHISTFVSLVSAEPSQPATMVALLVVLAALTKSAQFPFHSWLPDTMEAPTPVSALMHAGIINAGGVLLLRFSPLLARVPSALFLLTLIGTITAVIGLVAMWAQVNIKRTLAWSTVSQMGFMMVQCGLAAFPAAALHIIGHGCYKAWSFLRSGELPKDPLKPSGESSPTRKLALLIIGTLVALPALALASLLTGFSPIHSPGELSLGLIVALSLGQIWVSLLGVESRQTSATIARVAQAVAATIAGSILTFWLYRQATLFLEPVTGVLPVQEGVLAWLTAALPVVAFAGLSWLQIALPTIGRTAAGRAFYVHAINGFYFGALADRLVDRFWGFVGVKGVHRV